MQITEEQMRAFVGEAGVIFTQPLNDAAKRWGILEPLQVAHWLTQFSYETQGFTRMRESLNYSAEALWVKFGPHRISEEDAFKYGRTQQHPADQMEIGNRIYGGEWGRLNLGNTAPGDGWRFIGRGPGITGRANYHKASQALYNDETLIYRPEFLERPNEGSQAGGWFWHSRGLNEFADEDDLRAITAKWTGWSGKGDGAGVGLAQREARLHKAFAVFIT